VTCYRSTRERFAISRAFTWPASSDYKQPADAKIKRASPRAGELFFARSCKPTSAKLWSATTCNKQLLRKFGCVFESAGVLFQSRIVPDAVHRRVLSSYGCFHFLPPHIGAFDANSLFNPARLCLLDVRWLRR
jgi:hypothetical protein